MLLTRDQFREGVLKRDGYKCVICTKNKFDAHPDTPLDAHHIIERRLFNDGGYYLDNGATLCSGYPHHHIAAESTILSCDEIREAAGITNIALPEHLYQDQPYDKWGNPILENGQRLIGELYDDPSVQIILQPVLHLFTRRMKYPRTYHLPWSPGLTKDDRLMPNSAAFENKHVVVTVKMDGENTTMYNDYLHARSIEYDRHPSRHWVKNLHGKISHDIPEGWRLCGENLYAKHSIKYVNLQSYFLLFSIWNGSNCLSWDETVEWGRLLGLETVPVVYNGIWDEEKIRRLYTGSNVGNDCEGYVVRLAGSFKYRDFRYSVAKYVRKGHVQTHAHWMHTALIPNELTDKR